MAEARQNDFTEQNSPYGDMYRDPAPAPAQAPAVAPRMYTGREPTKPYNPSVRLNQAQYGDPHRQTTERYMQQLQEKPIAKTVATRDRAYRDLMGEIRSMKPDSYQLDRDRRSARMANNDPQGSRPGARAKAAAAGWAAEQAVQQRFDQQQQNYINAMQAAFGGTSKHLLGEGATNAQLAQAGLNARSNLANYGLQAAANARTNDLQAFGKMGDQFVTNRGNQLRADTTNRGNELTAYTQSLPTRFAAQIKDRENLLGYARKRGELAPPSSMYENMFGQAPGAAIRVGEDAVNTLPAGTPPPAGAAASPGAAGSAGSAASPGVAYNLPPGVPASALTGLSAAAPVPPPVVAAQSMSPNDVSKGVMDLNKEHDVAVQERMAANRVMRENAANEILEMYTPDDAANTMPDWLAPRVASLLQEHPIPASDDLAGKARLIATAMQNQNPGDVLYGPDNPLTGLVTGAVPLEGAGWQRWLSAHSPGNFFTDLPGSGRVVRRGDEQVDASNIPLSIYRHLPSPAQ